LKSSTYQPRVYRRWGKDKDLVSFSVVVKETDLFIRARRNLRAKAVKAIVKHRKPIEAYIRQHPQFLTTLEPCSVEEDAPDIVKEMAKVAQIAGVGPMAAVAGAIAEAVGKDLLLSSSEVIVENGGDIFLKISKPRLIGVYAGTSPFTSKVALEIQPEETPLGVCTSSGTVGHSLSFGNADAAIVLSQSTFLADAMATAIGNRIRSTNDIPKALDWAQQLPGVSGVVIIKDDKIGVWGKVKIVPVDSV